MMANLLAGGQDMAHWHIALSQSSTDEKASVAIEWIVLGTHKCNVKPTTPLDYSIKTLLERRRSRHFFVVGYAITEELTILWTATKFIAKENVRNPVGS
jgi:hypothetical protein